MRAFFALCLSLIAGVLLSMSLAIYLPLEQVNRMFITGLSAPIFICIFSVWSLRSDALKKPAIFFSFSIPFMLVAVIVGLTS